MPRKKAQAETPKRIFSDLFFSKEARKRPGSTAAEVVLTAINGAQTPLRIYAQTLDDGTIYRRYESKGNFSGSVEIKPDSVLRSNSQAGQVCMALLAMTHEDTKELLVTPTQYAHESGLSVPQALEVLQNAADVLAGVYIRFRVQMKAESKEGKQLLMLQTWKGNSRGSAAIFPTAKYDPERGGLWVRTNEDIDYTPLIAWKMDIPFWAMTAGSGNGRSGIKELVHYLFFRIRASSTRDPGDGHLKAPMPMRLSVEGIREAMALPTREEVGRRVKQLLEKPILKAFQDLEEAQRAGWNPGESWLTFSPVYEGRRLAGVEVGVGTPPKALQEAQIQA